jgi:hypothetical protein
MQTDRKTKKGISNLVFAVTVAVLLVVAAVGIGLYYTKPSQPPTPALKMEPESGGFFNSGVVTFIYNGNYTCTPSSASLFPSESSSVNTVPCEVGLGNGSTVANAQPVWVLVPAYAGLSIFGVPQLGASSQGYPTYQGQIILTDCGAGGTKAACADHPTLMYSPAFTVVEKYLNITSGVFGLPEGVLPTPAHSHLVNYEGDVPWYTVAVLVFDPNIMPNPVTGQCTQVVPSSLSNPTANCLNSLAALQSALTTSNPAIAAANKGNPIYDALGMPSTQVVVPGDLTIPELSNANSNLFLYFNVVNGNPYLNLTTQAP